MSIFRLQAVAVVLLLAPSCTFEGAPVPTDNDPPQMSDGSLDRGVCDDWATEHFDACSMAPSGPLIIDSNASLDTDLGVFVGAEQVDARAIVPQSGGDDALVLYVERFSIAEGVALRVIGRRPLAIVSMGDILIDGTLSAAANGSTPGPGGDSELCGQSRGVDGLDTYQGSGAAGGGGGALAGGGGSGGNGDTSDDDNQGAQGGVAMASLSTLHGGCPGGRGGGADDLDSFGERGAGGGGIALASMTAIRVDGGVNAGGGGGGGGIEDERSGGGGGGSGGTIVLDAPIVEIGGIVSANGGGGGEGSDGFDSDNADDGENGRADTDEANGGGGRSSRGGNGGDGSHRDSSQAKNGEDADGDGGGGGGGGGAGVVLIWSQLVTISGASSPRESATLR